MVRLTMGIGNKIMFKKITSVLIGLALVGFVSTAVAGGHKTDVFHCGCVAYAPGAVAPWGTAFLEWSELNVGKNSKGHQLHEAGDEETCTFYLDEFTMSSADYIRGGDDCQEVGATHTLAGVEVCVATPSDGALCG
jgi:hypothetical protein